MDDNSFSSSGVLYRVSIYERIAAEICLEEILRRLQSANSLCVSTLILDLPSSHLENRSFAIVLSVNPKSRFCLFASSFMQLEFVIALSLT